MVVALINGKIAGFLQLFHGKDKVITIDLIATDQAQRRKGIASAMIAFVETYSKGCAAIRTGTQVSNIPSLKLYEKLGFSVCSAQYIFHYYHPSGNQT